MEGDGVIVGIEDGEGGAPIAISRLPNRPRINQVVGSALQGPLAALGFPNAPVDRAYGRATVPRIRAERTLDVRVSKKGERDIRDQKGLQGVTRRDHVFILVERGPVDKLHLGDLGYLNRTL